ncbi:MAG: 50S ribosomal protein L25 [Patescibacteria group bacterium]
MEKISAHTRVVKKSVNNTIRKTGGVPAVVYGHGVPAAHLTVDAKVFSKLYKTTGETDIISLHIAGEKAARNVLVQDVTKDPVSNAITHVDFHQIRMDEKITLHIPLTFVGESAAVKADGGVLVKNINEKKPEVVELLSLAFCDQTSILSGPFGVKHYFNPRR